VLPTEEGVIVGQPRFVSPEAARGAAVDPRADIYSTASSSTHTADWEESVLRPRRSRRFDRCACVGTCPASLCAGGSSGAIPR
jgi:hypothetical protein